MTKFREEKTEKGDDSPFRYKWSTIKTYVVVMGKFGKFLYAKQFFDPPHCTFAEWYEQFKNEYSEALSTASRMAKLQDAETARAVSTCKYCIINSYVV